MQCARRTAARLASEDLGIGVRRKRFGVSFLVQTWNRDGSRSLVIRLARNGTAFVPISQNAIDVFICSNSSGDGGCELAWNEVANSLNHSSTVRPWCV